MKKKLISIVMASILSASSFCTVLADDLDVASEASMLDDATDVADLDNGGTDFSSGESFDDSGNVADDVFENEGDSQDVTINAEEDIKSYSVKRLSDCADIVFVSDLDKLINNNNDIDALSDDSTLDVTVVDNTTENILERVNYLKNVVDDKYKDFITEDSYKDLIVSEDNYTIGEDVDFYIVPYDVNTDLSSYEIKVSSENDQDSSLYCKNKSDYVYSFSMIESNICINVSKKVDADVNVEESEDENIDEDINLDSEVDNFTDEVAVEGCTCGSSESDPYHHDFDCPIFKEQFAKDCDCTLSSDFAEKANDDITYHDYTCNALRKAFSSVCTCVTGDAVAMHDDCEVIEKLHRHLCDCGKDYTSIDDILSNHDSNSAIYKYIYDWNEYVNSVSVTAVASGTNEWGKDPVDWSYAGGSFATTGLTNSTITVSGKLKNGNALLTKDTSEGIVYYANNGGRLLAKITNAGIAYIDGVKTLMDIHILVEPKSADGACFNVSGSYLSIKSGYAYNGSCGSGDHDNNVTIAFYKHGASTSVSVKGTSRIVDLDSEEGVRLNDSSIVSVYTSSNTEIKYNKTTKWAIGSVDSQVDSSTENKKSVQFLYNSPIKFTYRAGTGVHPRGTSFNRTSYKVTYHLSGAPSGVSTPVSVYFAAGGNTQQAVKSYNLTKSLSKAGYTFTGWKTDTTYKNNYNGVSCCNNNVDLYGKFTKLTGSVKVTKQFNATFDFKTNYMNANAKEVKVKLKGVTLTSGESYEQTAILKDGGSYTFTNVPVGKYVVQEYKVDSNHPSISCYWGKWKVGSNGNWSDNMTNNNGIYQTGNVTVSKNARTDVYFQNTPKTGSLTVSKEITNSDGVDLSTLSEEDRTVTINISGTNNFGKAVNLSHDIVLTGDSAKDKYTFTEVPTGRNYTITETCKNPKIWLFKMSTDTSGTVSTTSKDITYDQTSSTTLSSTFGNKFIDPRYVYIEKVDEADTNKHLEGAEFTLYQYNNTNSQYEELAKLKYDGSKELYGHELVYTSQNTGKFRVVETKNPDKYEGKWSQDIDIFTFDGSISKTYTATNTSSKKDYGIISINKVDNYSGDKILATDAEFTIYEWNKDKSTYEDTCEVTAKTFDSSQSGNNKVLYDKDEECYKSKNLYISDKNLGKFKVVETKNPTGYEGTWEQEFTLTKKVEPDSKSFTVENPSTVPQMGKIVVNKTIKKSDVHWAFGNPTFRFTVSGTDSQWNEKHTWQGYVEFKENMQADASGNLTLSYVIENVPIGTYEIIEANTLSYKFESCKKVTSNVTEKGNYLVATLAYNKDSETVPTAEGTFSNSHLGYDQYRHTDVVENLVSTEWK